MEKYGDAVILRDAVLYYEQASARIDRDAISATVVSRLENQSIRKRDFLSI